MVTEKEIKVLKKIYDLSIEINGSFYNSIHYLKLIDTIFSQELITKYSGRKIKNMTCGYLGRMARKDLISAAYGRIKNYAYFEGYYLREKGLENLKQLQLL